MTEILRKMTRVLVCSMCVFALALGPSMADDDDDGGEIHRRPLAAIFIDKLDALGLEGIHDLLESCHGTARLSVAVFHPLNRCFMDTGAFCEIARRPAQQGACGT